jgi:5-formyltetrahydrofolate cyclo-ligase
MVMDPKAEKRVLRRAIVERLLAMDPLDRRAQEAELSARLAGLPGFAEAEVVLLYVSAFPEEIATAPLLQLALALGKRLACPRVDRPARRLRLAAIAHPDHDLTPGTLGIREPRADLPELAPDRIDWALVPGLAFDDRGYRLGRGGGYYDRLLPTLSPDAPRWALILEPQWVERLPVEPHDQRLDGVASPRTTLAWPRDLPPRA